MTELIYPNFPTNLVKSQEHLDQYIAFIDSRPIIKSIPFKTNYHHKIPKSLGGSNLDKHKIHLTHKDHYEAHRLLWKAISGNKMQYAFWRMTYSKVNGSKKWLSAEDYSELREKQIMTVSGKYSEEKKAKAKASREKNGTCQKGIPWTEERKAKAQATREKNGTLRCANGPLSEEKRLHQTSKQKETKKINNTKCGTKKGVKRGQLSKESMIKRNETMNKNGTRNGIPKGTKIGPWSEERKEKARQTRIRTREKNGL